MQLMYDNPEVRDAFSEWYNAGEHKDISGKDIPLEKNPEIRAIVDFYNNEIAQEEVVQIKED